MAKDKAKRRTLHSQHPEISLTVGDAVYTPKFPIVIGEGDGELPEEVADRILKQISQGPGDYWVVEEEPSKKKPEQEPQPNTTNPQLQSGESDDPATLLGLGVTGSGTEGGDDGSSNDHGLDVGGNAGPDDSGNDPAKSEKPRSRGQRER